MKLLIFKSETTKAIYSWNGKQVVTIVSAKDRPVGKIMKGIPACYLEEAYDKNLNAFSVGRAIYTVLSKVDI